MNDAGGYLIVELDNESQREILSNMWECIHDIAFPETLDGSDNHAPVFRQQELTRNEGENQRSQSGYRYIETSIRRHDNTLSLAGSDDRGSLETILGTNGTAVAARAFDLLLNIAITVVYMSVCDSQAFDDSSSSLVGALSRITDLGAILNDSFSHEDTPWSCTVHRLVGMLQVNQVTSLSRTFEAMQIGHLRPWFQCHKLSDLKYGIRSKRRGQDQS